MTVIKNVVHFIKNRFKTYALIALLGIIAILFSCTRKSKVEYLQMENLVAWCIVPYDSKNRTPKERIAMLKELGLKKYAYDWREHNLVNTSEELQWAKKNDIAVVGIWIWIDKTQDSVGHLNRPNERIFEIIEEVGYSGQIWVGFNANFFEDMSESTAIETGATMIDYLSTRANSLNCKVALYNHGDWFGNPKNQIKIIEALPNKELGIVYNFHHAHDQIQAFPKLVDLMLPFLWTVNLNGLRQGGPKILPLGKGDHEVKMIQILKSKGYTGDFGILGHVEDADVATILQANLNGTKIINDQLNEN